MGDFKKVGLVGMALLIGLLTLAIMQGSFQESVNWGYRIPTGKTFVNTDSLQLNGAAVTDSVVASAWRYSPALPMSAYGTEGRLRVAFAADNVSGLGDSIQLQVRFRYSFQKATEDAMGVNGTYASDFTGTSVRWSTWYTLGYANTDSVFVYDGTIGTKGWGPANHRQYRHRGVGTGVNDGFLTDYVD